MLVIGSNTTEAHPVISYYMKRARKRGATLIVNDPRTIDLCRWADIHVQHRIGSDIALINGLMHEIIEQGWADEAFIEEHTEGFEELRETVERYPVERASEITGVPADVIRRVARMLGEAESAGVYYTLGITEHICGHRQRHGAGQPPDAAGQPRQARRGPEPAARPEQRAGGVRRRGAAQRVPGLPAGGRPAGRREVRAGVGPARPARPPSACTIPSMLAGLEEGSLQGALRVRREHRDDASPTPPARRPAWRPPSSSSSTTSSRPRRPPSPMSCSRRRRWAEVDGTFTNTERRVQRVRKALEPPGEARDDWWIFAELSKRLGYDLGFSSSAGIWEERARAGHELPRHHVGAVRGGRHPVAGAHAGSPGHAVPPHGRPVHPRQGALHARPSGCPPPSRRTTSTR